MFPYSCLSKFFASSAPDSTISNFHMFQNFLSSSSLMDERVHLLLILSLVFILSTPLLLMVVVLRLIMSILSLFQCQNYYFTFLPPWIILLDRFAMRMKPLLLVNLDYGLILDWNTSSIEPTSPIDPTPFTIWTSIFLSTCYCCPTNCALCRFTYLLSVTFPYPLYNYPVHDKGFVWVYHIPVFWKSYSSYRA